MGENKKDEVLEETKEMKKDIDEIQKDISEIQESVKDVKKKGSFQSVLLTIVILILFVAFALYGFATGVGYGVKKVKEPNPTKEDAKVDYTTFNNVDIEKVSEIYDAVQPMWHCDSPYFTDKKFTVNDITNDMAYTIGFKNLGYETKEFTAEDLDVQIDAILGKKYKFTHKTYENCPMYNYSNKTYKLVGEGCGGTCGPSNVEKIIGASLNDKELDIYVDVLFVDNNKVEYFKDYKHTQKVTNYVKDANMSEEGFAADTVENAKLGTTYKMIFNLEDNNYVFVSAEPVK